MIHINQSLQSRERVLTNTPMTRNQYGGLIATLLFIGLMLAWVMWPAPNLDGVHPVERCKYYSYAKTHGGNYQACYEREMENVRNRLMRGY